MNCTGRIKERMIYYNRIFIVIAYCYNDKVPGIATTISAFVDNHGRIYRRLFDWTFEIEILLTVTMKSLFTTLRQNLG